MEKKAHIEVDSFGFDFVFPELGTLWQKQAFLLSIGLFFCFRFQMAEAEFFFPASGNLP